MCNSLQICRSCIYHNATGSLHIHPSCGGNIIVDKSRGLTNSNVFRASSRMQRSRKMNEGKKFQWRRFAKKNTMLILIVDNVSARMTSVNTVSPEFAVSGKGRHVMRMGNYIEGQNG